MSLRAFLLAGLGLLIQAQSPWTPRDYALTAWPGEARLDPLGRHLVYQLDQPDLVANRTRSQLWQVDVSRGIPRQLAPKLDEAKSPRFSPRGRLAFLGSAKTASKEGEAPQAYLLEAAGPKPLTHRIRGVKGLEWRDEGHLILAAEPDPDALDQDQRARKDDVLVVDDEARLIPLALWELDLATGRLVRITDTSDRVILFKVSPDGHQVAAVHERGTRWEYDQKVPPVTRVWDLRSGMAAEVPVGPKVVPDELVWAPDNLSLLAIHRHFSHAYLSQAGIQAAVRVSGPDWRVEPFPLAWDRGFGPGVQTTTSGVLALLEDGLTRRVARLEGGKGALTWLAPPVEGHPELLVTEDSGHRGVALLSSASRPPDWYAVTFGPDAVKVQRRLTHLNPHLDAKRMARVEPFRVDGAEGPVEGLLYYPADYRPGRAYPLVLNPHGGPALHDRDEWNENDHHPAQLHAQAGAFVLKLNYSGSTGYGLAFAERLMGRYLGPELIDLKKAMTDLVSRGLVDPARIGLTGWSNGAILGWALAIDSPYPLKAASLGAGDVNVTSDWSTCQFGESYDAYYLGKSLVEDPDFYWQRSFLRRLGDVRTPTLIHHGDRDREVPTEQAWQGFRFLQQAGKAPVRLVLYPGEGHEFSRPSHIIRKLKEEMAWFATYFYHPPSPQAAPSRPVAPRPIP